MPAIRGCLPAVLAALVGIEPSAAVRLTPPSTARIARPAGAPTRISPDLYGTALRNVHDAETNRVMQEVWRPCVSEIAEPQPCRFVAGALPSSFPSGALLRNGPNPRHPSGPGGWLDGDAMVHCVRLCGEEARYSRTWVRTAGFAKEDEAGRRLFDGSLVAPHGLRLVWSLLVNGFRALQPQKDTSNTALLRLAPKRVLALMEQTLPTEIAVSAAGAVRTVAPLLTLGGALLDRARFPLTGGALTAHLKVDPHNGEACGVTYCASGEPSVRHDVISADGECVHSVIVPTLGTSVMVHDMAITTDAGSAPCAYSVLLDLPLTLRPERMLLDRFPVAFEPRNGARIGLIPRRGGAEEVAWAEVEPAVVLHTVNAHQAPDGTVHLLVLRSIPSTPSSFIESYTPAFFYEYVLSPRDGCLSEGYLSDEPVDFPAIDPRLVGADCRFGFAQLPHSIGGPNRYGPPDEGITIGGVGKFDLHTGEQVGAWSVPAGWWISSEPAVVPKQGSEPANGDNVFVLVFGTAVPDAGGAAAPDAEADDGRASRLFVLDAADLGAGPQAVVELPGAVPYGLHSLWVHEEDLVDE